MTTVQQTLMFVIAHRVGMEAPAKTGKGWSTHVPVLQVSMAITAQKTLAFAILVPHVQALVVTMVHALME